MPLPAIIAAAVPAVEVVVVPLAKMAVKEVAMSAVGSAAEKLGEKALDKFTSLDDEDKELTLNLMGGLLKGDVGCFKEGFDLLTDTGKSEVVDFMSDKTKSVFEF